MTTIPQDGAWTLTICSRPYHIEKCKHGVLYRLRSRNLSLGVFDKTYGWFIGIREKFYDEFLDVEYHYDIGPPHGTAKPIEELDVIPSKISLDEYLGTIGNESKRPMKLFKDLWYIDTNDVCNEPADWDEKIGLIGKESRRPLKMGEKSGWIYIDTGDPISPPDKCAASIPNHKLFNWLKTKEILCQTKI